MPLTIGPIILDLLGPEMNQEEQEILQHPLVGGVILFARNFIDPVQMTELCSQIRKSRKTPLLITVDQEGGRVQRLQKGFTRLPAMGTLGKAYDRFPEQALQLAEACGWLMAAELLTVGIDLSFAPVLDLNKTNNSAIGDRAFHQDAMKAALLAKAVMQGMKNAGMAATGKHFPGHGSVQVDSHQATPTDLRNFEEISTYDLIPFLELIRSDIHAIMPAHIVFPEVDTQPAGFSRRWLHEILRQQLHFAGVIISDDLNMKGANVAGNYSDRAQAALEAGCDIILICNNRAGAMQMLDRLPHRYFLAETQFNMLRGHFTQGHHSLRMSRQWQYYHNFFLEQESLWIT